MIRTLEREGKLRQPLTLLDLAGKIRTIEMIDLFVVRQIVNYFRLHSEQFGGVMIVPDH